LNLLDTVQKEELTRFLDALKRDVVMPAWRLFPGNSLRERVEQFFVNSGLVKTEQGKVVFKPKIARIYKAPYGFKMIVGLYPGISFDTIMQRYPELCYAVEGECKLWMDNSNWLHIQVFNRGLPRRFMYDKELAARIKKYPLALPIGISRQGFVILKLFQGEQFGVLVMGMPRWGKSVWFRQALTAVVTNYTPLQVIMYPIDLKDGVEFDKFQRCPHTKMWAGNNEQAARVVKEVLNEIRVRAIKIKEARVTSILEYNTLGRDYIPHILLPIDEYGLLDNEVKDNITKICMAGSFAGVHPIICVQRATTDAMPGTTKAMLPVRLCFKTSDKANSQWALGDKNSMAAFVKDKGRAVYLNGYPRQVQVMWLEPEDCEGILQRLYPISVPNNVRRLVP